MATFAYLRVSTKDQTTEQQLAQIQGAGHQIEKDRVYVEQGVSGKVPALQREQFSKLNERLEGVYKINYNLPIAIERRGRDGSTGTPGQAQARGSDGLAALGAVAP
ncbi:recombinase family protein, partial [Azovibrio restrictus]|uniref:recombinase family protein n=1 Tax=Azovibrio restrictus TaxID=146938 RepID=UPI0026ED77DF